MDLTLALRVMDLLNQDKISSCNSWMLYLNAAGKGDGVPECGLHTKPQDALAFSISIP